MKKVVPFHFIFFFIILLIPVMADNYSNPRIAIVISKTSFDQNWEIVQMSAHGWGAIVNLAGIPYNCLFLEDLAANELSKYSSLVFTQCTHLPQKGYEAFFTKLKSYLAGGGNIIVDGYLAVFDEAGVNRNTTELEQMLDIEFSGLQGGNTHRLKTDNTRHYVSQPYEYNQYITQHLADSLNILGFPGNGEVILVATDEKERYPYLSVRDTGKNRITLISEFGTWAGAGSFFRNFHPQVFYANKLYNILIRSVHWSVYGDVKEPFPVPQVSNANVTAIIRHDGDGSDIPDAQVTTINYLTEFAQETGVVPLYTWVSSGAAETGWDKLGPLGVQLEAAGGEIGTHSRFHRINDKMNPERWKEELDGSISEIESGMKSAGYPIGRIDCFINPGNTIKMTDYSEVSDRFHFYMTHGFEQDVPLGWGNLTWFAESNPDFIVLENITAPDYQWFYDPQWSYTTAQATAYEEAVFDHLYYNIRRGAIFNEMWHDYSITAQPQRPKERIINDSHIAFYDAIKAKFATHDIYCPTPHDLANKLRAMAQWNYLWHSDENEIEMILDLGPVHHDSIAAYTGGMGIFIENTHFAIQSVAINGKAHFAFNKKTVILPNLKKGRNTLRIKMGKYEPDVPRLLYISKRMPVISKTEQGIEVQIITKSKAKFAFYSSQPVRVLNADWYEWNRKGDNILYGYVTSDRNIIITNESNY